MTRMFAVVCPSCFEEFFVPDPGVGESGGEVEMDYDCEICCRPMVVAIGGDGAWARSLDDL